MITMAMNAFEIFGVLKLDTKEFNNGLDKAGDKAKNFGGNLTGSFVKAQLIVDTLRTGASALTGFMQGTINESVSFESAFTGVRKTVDATEQEFAELSDWIMDASTKMASSKEEIAGTMEIAGQLGIKGVDGLEKFTETMIMLGDTTNLNAEEAASALAKFGNIAGIAAEDTDRIGSVIVDLGNNFATTEADIVNMSTRLASAGTIAGLSATDILALSTAMSSVGINAEAGGTAMSTILTKIGRAVDAGSDSLELYAKTAGMTAEEFAATWRSAPTEALQGFVKGLDGVVESGGNVTAILDDLNIKGIRESNTIKSLALASDVLDGAVNKANKAFEDNVALQNEAALRYGTTQSQAIQTAEAFKNLQKTIGDELAPTYGELMSFSKAAMDSMNTGLQEGGLTGLMESMGTALSDALAMLEQKLPTVIDAGMHLIGALGQGMIQNIGVITDSAFQVANIILDKILEATEGDGSAFLNIINTISSKLIENAPNIITTGFAIVENIANGIIQALPTLPSVAIDIILMLVDSLLSNIDGIVQTALDMILALADGLIDALPVLIEKAPEIIEKLVDAIVRNIPKLMEASMQIVVALVKGIIENLPQILEAGMEIVNSLGVGILQMLSALWDGGAKMIETVWEGVKSLDPLQWGKDMIDSFIAGINDRIAKVADAARGIAKTVKDILGFSEPKYGPLADFHTFAPDMMELFAQGIADNEDMLQRQVEKSFNFGNIASMTTVGKPTNSLVSNNDTARTQTVILQLDRTELGRIVYDLNNEETRRIGVKLAGGVV